jgi:allophanate hydrolase subunit 1
MSEGEFIWRDYGDFTLIRSEDSERLLDLQETLLKEYSDKVKQVIYTPKELLVHCREAIEWRSVKMGSERFTTPSKYILPIYFGIQNDWKGIKEETGLTKEAYLEQLLETSFTLDLLGFVPGFLYFKGLPDQLKCARKKNPSLKIPSNSLAVGGEYLGFYSLATPSGWSVLGHCPLLMLDFERMPPVELKVHDEVQIKAISKEDFDQLTERKLTIKAYNEGA